VDESTCYGSSTGLFDKPWAWTRTDTGKRSHRVTTLMGCSPFLPASGDFSPPLAQYPARPKQVAGGGTDRFNNALGRLRTLELVQGHGELRASDNLFDAR
jgi:hypothetical protein